MNYLKVILMYGLVVLVLGINCKNGRANKIDFVHVRGSQFVVNGSPFVFNGFNSYWMMNVASDPTQRYKVSQVFRDASAAGLSVCRTWAFADGGDKALQMSPGSYDERVFEGLDFVISEARKFNMRLVLSFVNNYNDFGGRGQYIQWARNAGILQINGNDDFYTHPVVKAYYRNHVQRVITRVNTITRTPYRDDSTIMAWELMNEPRCQVDYSGNTINGWVQEMAAYVKSLDRKHLLEIGMEGFYGDTMPNRKQINPGYQVGTDFISNNLIKEIDFATIHAYPDIWLSGQNEEAQMAFMGRWMESHFMDAKTILKKPIVIAEFGKSSKDPGYSVNARDLYMAAVYQGIYKFARNGGILGGALVWQIMAQDMQSYNDGYEIVLAQDQSTGTLISHHSHAMTTLSHLFTATQTRNSLNDPPHATALAHHPQHHLKNKGHHHAPGAALAPHPQHHLKNKGHHRAPAFPLNHAHHLLHHVKNKHGHHRFHGKRGNNM